MEPVKASVIYVRPAETNAVSNQQEEQALRGVTMRAFLRVTPEPVFTFEMDETQIVEKDLLLVSNVITVLTSAFIPFLRTLCPRGYF